MKAVETEPDMEIPNETPTREIPEPLTRPDRPTPSESTRPRRRRRIRSSMAVFMDQILSIEERRVEADLNKAQSLANIVIALTRLANTIENVARIIQNR
ncbi:uncharacterized protein LOC111356210 isoform X2 [Spodoptera litura]|nr:uncharacterized protein LOC111356210 isoform X2 [Spodoptera litura]